MSICGWIEEFGVVSSSGIFPASSCGSAEVTRIASFGDANCRSVWSAMSFDYLSCENLNFVPFGDFAVERFCCLAIHLDFL